MDPSVGKLAVRKICCTALPGGDDVSPAGIARMCRRRWSTSSSRGHLRRRSTGAVDEFGGDVVAA